MLSSGEREDSGCHERVFQHGEDAVRGKKSDGDSDDSIGQFKKAVSAKHPDFFTLSTFSRFRNRR